MHKPVAVLSRGGSRGGRRIQPKELVGSIHPSLEGSPASSIGSTKNRIGGDGQARIKFTATPDNPQHQCQSRGNPRVAVVFGDVLGKYRSNCIAAVADVPSNLELPEPQRAIEVERAPEQSRSDAVAIDVQSTSRAPRGDPTAVATMGPQTLDIEALGAVDAGEEIKETRGCSVRLIQLSSSSTDDEKGLQTRSRRHFLV